MTHWPAALLLLASVALLCRWLGVARHGRTVLALAEASLALIGDPLRTDDDKETALQRHAFRLFKLFALLLAGGVVAVGLPLGALWLADRLGLASSEAVLATSLSWPVLVGGLAATVVIVVAAQRRGAAGDPAETFENRYSPAARWLHHLAFAGAPVLKMFSRLEDRMHRTRIARVQPGSPVFITALPRAGTTLLLNLVAQREEFVTHTYRRMPFLLTPLIWERFSRLFRVTDTPRERAHGDGMLVSADSPEALEEMLWLNFWPEHIGATSIRPFTGDEERPGFVAFFRQHMRKLILADGGGHRRRYVSKNNANTGRVAWLVRTFPEARVVVPFRTPLQHAASLLRQHRRFLTIHRQDPFSRHYMAGVGHFDFGENLRPIDFGGWTTEAVDGVARSAPTTLEYWVRYWIAGYRQLADQAGEHVHLVDFDALCAAPAAGLAQVADFLEIADRDSFIASGREIRAPKLHRVDAAALPAALLEEAATLHARLQELAGLRMTGTESGSRRTPPPPIVSQ